jgi:hypothetical protein
MDLDDILSELREERDEIQRAITALERAFAWTPHTRRTPTKMATGP